MNKNFRWSRIHELYVTGYDTHIKLKFYKFKLLKKLIV